MMKVYLFKRKHGRVTHGVYTRHASMGIFELDRLFGGGLYIFCTGKTGSGPGVLSEIVMSTGHVTCRKCLKEMKKQNISVDKIPNNEVWPPNKLRKLGPPRAISGVPGAAVLFALSDMTDRGDRRYGQ